jgi:hypothetical protein
VIMGEREIAASMVSWATQEFAAPATPAVS